MCDSFYIGQVKQVMSPQAFSFPFPETRFFRAGRLIYKFKIRWGSSYSGPEVMGERGFKQDQEEIVRTVLGNLDSLQPFSSAHFNVFPYKKQWEGASKMMCEHCEKNLKAYPYILTLYLEKNMKNGEQAEEKENTGENAQQSVSICEPLSKRCKGGSPLEEAILQDSEAESDNASTDGRLYEDHRHARGDVREDQAHADKSTSLLVGEDEEEDEQEDEEDDDAGTPSEPGVLSRLASHIFPFSWQ